MSTIAGRALRFVNSVLPGKAGKYVALLFGLSSQIFALQSSPRPAVLESGTDCGVSAVWVFANLVFAGMRAQDTDSDFWLVLSFIFGFPGTLLTLLVVENGGERAYGIDLPRRQAR